MQLLNAMDSSNSTMSLGISCFFHHNLPVSFHEGILIFNAHSKHCQQKQARSWVLLTCLAAEHMKVLIYALFLFPNCLHVKESLERNWQVGSVGEKIALANDCQSWKRALNILKWCSNKSPTCRLPSSCFVTFYFWFQVSKANAKKKQEAYKQDPIMLYEVGRPEDSTP